MPDSPVIYDDVEVLDQDDLGFVCRIGNARAFVGKYVPLDGTTVRRTGDRGSLALPRWFVEQQGLPLDRRLSDREVEAWLATLRLRAATAQDDADAHPDDAEAQDALDRALEELSAAMLLRARRQDARSEWTPPRENHESDGCGTARLSPHRPRLPKKPPT